MMMLGIRREAAGTTPPFVPLTLLESPRRIMLLSPMMAVLIFLFHGLVRVSNAGAWATSVLATLGLYVLIDKFLVWFFMKYAPSILWRQDLWERKR
jgi:hypothetical protein